MVTCNLRIDFRAGPVPGELLPTVVLVAPSGAVIATEDAPAVGVGKALTIGPVNVLAGLPVNVVPIPQVAASQGAAPRVFPTAPAR